MVHHQEMASRSVQRTFPLGSGNSHAQGGLDAIARMAGVHCASALPVAAAWRVGLHQADGAPQGKRGVMVAAALRHGLATHCGVGDSGIELCRLCVLAFYRSGIVPGGALILSVYMHIGAGLTQDNWQILPGFGPGALACPGSRRSAGGVDVLHRCIGGGARRCVFVVLRLMGDCWLCATCCWVSCLTPTALHVLTVFQEKFCVPSLVHVASAISRVSAQR